MWICYLTGAITVVVSAVGGSPILGAIEGLFYFLAGVGVRERSRFAGIAAFLCYGLSGIVLQKYTGRGFSVVRVIFLALLFANIRGNWLAARWQSAEETEYAPMRLDKTFADKLADQLPTWLWPKARIVFYILAGLEFAALLLALVAPLPGGE